MATPHEFAEALRDDPALLQRAKAAFAKEFATFATAEGFDLSPQDVAAYMDNHDIRLAHILEGADAQA